VPQVRVIGADGEQLGVLHPRDAVRIARDLGLDLVEVAPNADPPVCKIIDFGKYQYEAKKKAHEAKKNQVVITVKEIKFRPATDDHDYEYRIKHSREWLNDGNKVRATIFFRGREMSHRELGYKILERVKNDLADIGDVEVMPKMEGNQLFIIIAPKRQKVVAKGESKPKPAAPADEAKPKSAAPTPAEKAQEPAAAS
jgi:translation initiation factor IF-3